MADDFERLLRLARRSLTASAVLRGSLTWLAAGSLVGGAVAALTRLASLPLPALAVLCGVSLGAAVLGAARAFARRPGYAVTAALLDRGLGDHELMSAALLCSARGLGGRFDSLIMDRALSAAALDLAAGRRSVAAKLGRTRGRSLALRATLAAGALCLGTAMAAFAGPLAGGSHAITKAAEDGADPSGSEASQAALGKGETPRSVARSLFPDDPRLAMAAERALAAGKVDDLSRLLERADADLARRIARSSSALERERLERERQALRESAQAAMERMSRNKPGTGQGKEGEAGQEPQQAAGAGQRGQPGEGDGQGPQPPPGSQDPRELEARQRDNPGRSGSLDIPGQGGQEDTDDQAERTPGGSDEGAPPVGGRGALKAGTGEGSLRSFDRLEPSAVENGKKAELGQDERGMMELVLPGDGPMTRAVSPKEAAAGAEAALARERVPMEYEEYVRSYYLAISELDEGEDK